jgi:hypothetical protein
VKYRLDLMTVRINCAVVLITSALAVVAFGNSSSYLYPDLDGIAHRPLDPEKGASVLFFYSEDCPISNGYAPEINRICASHTNFEFYIVQVDPQMTPEQGREHARQYGLRAPVLLDSQHRLVKLAKANVTPEAVVFGKHGRVLYRGRIDDLYATLGKKRWAATQHDLIDALDAIDAGRKIKVKETPAIGCRIE